MATRPAVWIPNSSFVLLFTNIQLAQEALANLEKLVPLVQFAPGLGKTKVDVGEFVVKAEQLLSGLETCYRSSLEGFIRQQFLHAEDRQRGDTPWSIMHHATGRLMSYFYAVGIILRTRQLFPELFFDFSVEHVSSSMPGDPPDIRKRVDGMVSRLTPDRTVVETFRRQEAQLQEW